MYALALVPGRRRLAARLGLGPRRWSLTADPLLRGAWGGPTLVGAWFVHAMTALGIQVICMAVIRRLHGRTLAEAL